MTNERRHQGPGAPSSWLPTNDVVAAQLLALMTDEPGFLRVANVHAGERPPVLERVG